MSNNKHGLVASWDDVWLAAGVRTPFVDYTGALGLVSPIDLGIKVAREVFRRSGLPASDVGTVVAGSVAQTSFDAFMLPRHIGLYSGVPQSTPAHLVQRVCGTGIEAIMQVADAIALGRTQLGLAVGAESMSRNPVAAFTHRSGFRLGQVEFRDFLWEALLDTASKCTMGMTAENLARQYQITREDVDKYAERSFARAVAAQSSGFLAGEITTIVDEVFQVEGLENRSIKLPRGAKEVAADTHIRASSVEALAKIRPAFGGVQSGGNSSAIVDGGGAVLIGAGAYLQARNHQPLARLIAGAAVGVQPHIMGIGPVPAIQAVVAQAGLTISDIDRFEINEAFGAQVMACARELNLDENKLNVNGGAIAIGHPLAATGVRLSLTLARELQRAGLRYGIASACIGGGQGIALLLENPAAA